MSVSTVVLFFFFFSSRRRHTRYWRDWSSDVCSSDLYTRCAPGVTLFEEVRPEPGAAVDQVPEECRPEEGREDQGREQGHPRPEGHGDRGAVQQTGQGCLSPPSYRQEQGGSEGTGEKPPGVVAKGDPVVRTALRPHPEAQRGGSGIQDAVHQGEEQRSEERR